MIDQAEIAAIGARLAQRTGAEPPAAWDLRIDVAGLDGSEPMALTHAKQQALMRAYQARYVLLPAAAPGGCAVERLRRHYDPVEMARLELSRHALEAELLEPRAEAARRAAIGRDWRDYAQALLPEVRGQAENLFTAYLRTSPNAAAHYRHFLIQSSADLLAEASASAMGVVGEFGAPQSALFRILIDEFGYGAHGRKHAVLYQSAMRDFGLCADYNAYWPLFDTVALDLHNTIHHLFQNPRNFFMQVGFLLFAETAYQRSTQDHFRYLREFHPQADARYFGEHAHIDLHHTRMVIDEVAGPLVATYGEAAGAEIVAGAELTRAAFDASGAHLLAVAQAFDAAGAEGRAAAAGPDLAFLGRGLTPAAAGALGPDAGPVQVGGIGILSEASAFAAFPTGAYGRLLKAPA